MIILRRLFIITAALYFLRSITMICTSLPVATQVTDCQPKVWTAKRLKLIRWWEIFFSNWKISEQEWRKRRWSSLDKECHPSGWKPVEIISTVVIHVHWSLQHILSMNVCIPIFTYSPEMHSSFRYTTFISSSSLSLLGDSFNRNVFHCCWSSTLFHWYSHCLGAYFTFIHLLSYVSNDVCTRGILIEIGFCMF